MKKVLFIRADGNSDIGLGHIMRSMTIATAFKDSGYECIYISSMPVSTNLFERYGYPVIALDYAYDRKTVKEACQIADILTKNHADYILVDSYYTDNEYLSILRKSATLICINSTKKRLLTDYLINENIASNRDYLEDLYSGSGTRLLLGSEYSPIRKEFHNRTYLPNRLVQTVLITTGGGDQYNFMTQFMRIVKADALYSKMQFIFVSGGCNTYYDELVSEALGTSNIRVIRNPRNMADLMQESDVAITAGGTTVLELSVIGLPTIGIAVADDQEAGLSFMGQTGMIRYAGCIRDDAFWDTILIELRNLINDYGLRKKLSESSKAHIDGKGAQRIFYQITGEYNGDR